MTIKQILDFCKFFCNKGLSKIVIGTSNAMAVIRIPFGEGMS